MTQHNTTEHNTTGHSGAEHISARPRHDHRADTRRDSIVDPGDAHDKGEQSLCVGEAA